MTMTCLVLPSGISQVSKHLRAIVLDAFQSQSSEQATGCTTKDTWFGSRQQEDVFVLSMTSRQELSY
jgi:hypothetical protein